MGEEAQLHAFLMSAVHKVSGGLQDPTASLPWTEGRYVEWNWWTAVEMDM